MRVAAFLVVSSLITSLAAQTGAEVPPAFAANWQQVRQGLQERLQKLGIVGGSLVFSFGARTLAAEYFGFADLASRRRIDRDTIYHWASITKTMTGIATLQLRRRGKLRLADRIVDHLPELKRVHGGQWQVETVTLRHLLSHSGGFRSNTFPFAGGKPWQPYEPARWEQLAALLPYTELLFEPGSKFSYSNPGIVFVGRTIEQVCGEDFEVHIDKNILKPLGMHRSFFDNTPYHLLQHRSNNYSFVDGEHRANGLDLDTGITVSNGGLNAPIPDMLRYLRFLLGVGDRQVHDGVLPRAELIGMWQPLHVAGKTRTHQRSMSLTFFVYENEGTRVVGHTGSQKAFQAFFLIDPATGAAAIAAFNSHSVHADPALGTRPMMLQLMDRMLDQVFPLFRVERVPVERVPVKREPVKQVPVKRVPVKRVPVKRVPVKRVPVKQVPVKQVPVKREPGSR